MSGYNLTRTVDELLRKTKKSPPSFSVHLYQEYWRLNDGGKFLYNNQVASLLDDIRAHRIPVDLLELFDSAQVPFYDGCMLVELLDYRPPNPGLDLTSPERTRVVLHPTSETLYADITLLNQKHGNKWSDRDVLQVESKLLLATAPPLCLNPDPHLTRIANHTLRISTPMPPVSLKRKVAALAPEEHEVDRARRTKIMQFMDPRQHRSHAPNYRIQNLLDQRKVAAAMAIPPSGLPGVPGASDYQAQLQMHQQRIQIQAAQAQAQAQVNVAAAASASSPTLNGKAPAGTYLQLSQHQNLMGHPSPNTRTSPMLHPLYPAGTNGVDPARAPTPGQRAPTPSQRAMTPSQAGQAARAPTPAHRAPTPAARQFTQSPQVNNPPSIPPQQLPQQPQQGQTNGFKPAVPSLHFLQQPPQRGHPQQVAQQQPKASGSGVPVGYGTPQQQQMLHQQQQQQQQQAITNMNYQKQLLAIQAQNAGRATPQQIQAAQAQQQAQIQARMAASRSPIPPNTQVPGYPAPGTPQYARAVAAATAAQQQQAKQQLPGQGQGSAQYQSTYGFAGYAQARPGAAYPGAQQNGAGYPSYSAWPPANGGVGLNGARPGMATHAQMVAAATASKTPGQR